VKDSVVLSTQFGMPALPISMAAEVGAELTLTQNRLVPARFKGGYGSVGAWFFLIKAKAMNAFGEDYHK
jgi:adenylylsulfate reductase subunit A